MENNNTDLLSQEQIQELQDHIKNYKINLSNMVRLGFISETFKNKVSNAFCNSSKKRKLSRDDYHALCLAINKYLSYGMLNGSTSNRPANMPFNMNYSIGVQLNQKGIERYVESKYPDSIPKKYRKTVDEIKSKMVDGYLYIQMYELSTIFGSKTATEFMNMNIVIK